MDDDQYLSFFHADLQQKTTISAKTLEKCELILKELSNPLINFSKLKIYCFSGIPDECNGLRALLWKMLLGYLPPNRGKWDSTLKQNRKNYQDFVKEFVKTKSTKHEEQDHKQQKEEEKNAKSSTKSFGKKVVVTLDDCNLDDHPLSTSKTSGWNTLFKDRELWDEIEKDTRRTRKEISLFGQSTNNEVVYTYSKQMKKEDPELHSDVLSRILFIYGKLNPGVRYVQGMNELLAPIYYCFIHDDSPIFKGFAEADAFYCFSNLMGDAKENFVKSLDETDSGIKSRIANLNNMLRRVDQNVWQHLYNEKVNPQYYSLRWLMLMLTQEFQLMDVLRLWDSLLSVPNRSEFLNYCCLAIILHAKEDIIDHEFPAIMQTLQKHNFADVEQLLRKAVSLYRNYGNANDLNLFNVGL